MTLNFFKSIFLAILFLTFLIGCAKRPENIPASYYSLNNYSEWNCKAINTEIKMIKRYSLHELYKKQDSKVNSDFITAGLSSIFKLKKDYENNISREKGKLEALEGILIKKNCKKEINIAIY